MERVFGLTADQLVILVGLGIVLFLGLLVLKLVFKLTMGFVKLGCVGILAIVLIVFVAMLLLPG